MAQPTGRPGDSSAPSAMEDIKPVLEMHGPKSILKPPPGFDSDISLGIETSPLIEHPNCIVDSEIMPGPIILTLGNGTCIIEVCELSGDDEQEDTVAAMDETHAGDATGMDTSPGEHAQGAMSGKSRVRISVEEPQCESGESACDVRLTEKDECMHTHDSHAGAPITSLSSAFGIGTQPAAPRVVKNKNKSFVYVYTKGACHKLFSDDGKGIYLNGEYKIKASQDRYAIIFSISTCHFTVIDTFHKKVVFNDHIILNKDTAVPLTCVPYGAEIPEQLKTDGRTATCGIAGGKLLAAADQFQLIFADSGYLIHVLNLDSVLKKASIIARPQIPTGVDIVPRKKNHREAPGMLYLFESHTISACYLGDGRFRFIPIQSPFYMPADMPVLLENQKKTGSFKLALGSEKSAAISDNADDVMESITRMLNSMDFSETQDKYEYNEEKLMCHDIILHGHASAFGFYVRTQAFLCVYSFALNKYLTFFSNVQTAVFHRENLFVFFNMDATRSSESADDCKMCDDTTEPETSAQYTTMHEDAPGDPDHGDNVAEPWRKYMEMAEKACEVYTGNDDKRDDGYLCCVVNMITGIVHKKVYFPLIETCTGLDDQTTSVCSSGITLASTTNDTIFRIGYNSTLYTVGPAYMISEIDDELSGRPNDGSTNSKKRSKTAH